MKVIGTGGVARERKRT